MTDINISLTGTEELKKGVNNVSDKITSGELLLQTGYKIEAHAKMNWGQGSHEGGYPNVQTGRLRASINTQLSPDKTECVVGTIVYYAPFVEFGHTITRGIGTRGGLIRNTYKMNPFSMGMTQTRAYPFMFPALTQTQESGEMDGVFGEFANGIERAWIV